MRKLYQSNESGLSSVEVLAYASVGILLALVVSELSVLFKTRSEQDRAPDSIVEAQNQFESKLQDAFSFNINDCPRSINGTQVDETLILHTINLNPEEHQSMFPALGRSSRSAHESVAFESEARRSAIFSPVYEPKLDESGDSTDSGDESDDVETALFEDYSPHKKTVTHLDDTIEMTEGDLYAVDTESGPQFIKLISLEIEQKAKSDLSLIKAKIQPLSAGHLAEGKVREVQVALRTVNSGREQVCWSVMNREAENCYSNGGLPLDEFGQCHYQSKESLARATCAALAGSGEIKNTQADLAACRLGFIKGARGEAAAI